MTFCPLKILISNDELNMRNSTFPCKNVNRTFDVIATRFSDNQKCRQLEKFLDNSSFAGAFCINYSLFTRNITTHIWLLHNLLFTKHSNLLIPNWRQDTIIRSNNIKKTSLDADQTASRDCRTFQVYFSG